MKKIISLALIALIALSLFACDQPSNDAETTAAETTTAEETTTKEASTSQTTTEETTKEQTTLEEPTAEPEDLKQNWDEDGVLKILCIGNSFSVDAMEFLYGVLSDLGIENIKLGNLAIGGCSISMHYNNSKSGDAAYIYSENTTGIWKTNEGYVMSDIIERENWDFISLQQASHDSGVENTYRRLSALIDTIESWCPNARIVWHMTWAYQQDSTHGSFPVYNSDQMTMYNRIISTVQARVATEPAIEKIIPSGTAIQNARAGWIGDTLTRDGFHLSNLGRYIAALTFAQTLTGMSVGNVTYAPGGFTIAERDLAIEAATLAVAKPFEVSTPTSEAPKEPSIEDLNELDLTFERGYYFACDTNGKHFDLVQGSPLANTFYATQIFTKETLPAGSIIVLADGWEFRPEGWLGDEGLPNSMRPGMSSDTMIVIDELWWGEFTYRAFNIRMKSQQSLLDMTAEDMVEIFKIYVPYDPSAQQ